MSAGLDKNSGMSLTYRINNRGGGGGKNAPLWNTRYDRRLVRLAALDYNTLRSTKEKIG